MNPKPNATQTPAPAADLVKSVKVLRIKTGLRAGPWVPCGVHAFCNPAQ